MNREDFLMCKDALIYLDNGATTFKPKQVIIRLLTIIRSILLIVIEVIMILVKK